jgi:hypothetical protein
MDKPHCKDVAEDLFEKSDRHYQLQEETDDLTGLEPLAFQHQLEKNRIHKFRKVTDEEL